MDAEMLQRSWDGQQEAYLPDREARLAVMIDLVGDLVGPTPRVLDLAGGTGSITRRLLARLPGARSVVLDTDPVLLTIARASFADEGRVDVVEADLGASTWAAAFAGGADRFDAVLTATALHWLTPERVAGVYREARLLLRPGGLFANADHMPDHGLPGLSSRLAATDAERAARLRQRTGVADWERWWEDLRAVSELAEAFAVRDRVPHDHDHTRSAESSDWHVAALREAGFAEAGLAWRGRRDALAVALAA